MTMMYRAGPESPSALARGGKVYLPAWPMQCPSGPRAPLDEQALRQTLGTSYELSPEPAAVLERTVRLYRALSSGAREQRTTGERGQGGAPGDAEQQVEGLTRLAA